MHDFTGQVALISGAKGGLGTTVTQAFLDAGATVVGVSRSIKPNDFAHERFFAAPGELNSSEAAAAVVNEALRQAGRIDIVVHLVGAFAGGSPLEATSAETMHSMLETNFLSAFFLLQAALPALRGHGSGRVLCIGSRAASQVPKNVVAYAASKAALAALVRGVAAENREHAITANLVTPGTIDTPANRAAMPQADASRWVQPKQIAALLLHLASPLSAQISGVEIPIGEG